MGENEETKKMGKNEETNFKRARIRENVHWGSAEESGRFGVVLPHKNNHDVNNSGG